MRRLAVSFVLTAITGCPSRPVGSGNGGSHPSAPEVVKGKGANEGTCQYYPSGSAGGNPPAIYEIECPPELGGPPVGARPKGKETWLRIRPWLQVVANEKRCRLYGEAFCPAPPVDAPCMWAKEIASVPCVAHDPDTGHDAKVSVEEFVWKDVAGTCRHVAAFECGPGCKVPDGEVVPCP